MVGEDGLGYTDIGEEIDWTNEDAKEDWEEEGKKDSKGKRGQGNTGKRKATEQPVPGARERMQKMMQLAATKQKSSKVPVDTKGTDELLDDILGGLDADVRSSSKSSIGARINMRSTPRSVSMASKSFSHSANRASLGTPKSVAFTTPVANSRMSKERNGGYSVKKTGNVKAEASSPLKDVDQDVVRNPSEPIDDSDHGTLHMDFDYGIDNDDDDNEGDTQNETRNGKDFDTVKTTEINCDAKDSSTPLPEEKPSDASSTPWRTPAGAMKEVETPASEAPASGWKALYNEEDEGCLQAEDDSAIEPWQDDGTLPLDSESRLPFYLLDAHEEISNPGTVFLFGKIPVQSKSNAEQFVSCCAVVKNMPRTLFFVPRERIQSPEIDSLSASLEPGDKETRKKLLAALHEAFSSTKAEVREVLSKHGITQFTMKPVQRQYAFEDQDVLHGKQWVLKVRYAAKLPTLPLGLSGDTYCAVFGSNQSSLEALMLKRKIMGPSWVSLKHPRRIDPSAQVSYSRVEIELDGYKSIFAVADGTRPSPPLLVAALHLKTVINPSNAANEVVSASVVYLPNVTTDGPTQFNPRDLKHFSAVRKLDGVGYPSGFEAEVKRMNSSEIGRRNGGVVLAMQPNERALLTMLVCRLKELDPDVFVGHNFAGFDLDVLLHRMQALKVPHWSSLGRLKRSRFPNLGGGGHTFGGGAGAGQLSVVAGRLLCDTYIAARDLVRETDYTLTTLSRNLLGETRTELAAADIPPKFATTKKLLGLVHHTESDAWLSLKLAHFLAVLPLTRQLAELSGSLWSKALLNQRAQRIEYLLLHEFHNNKFLLPDKISQREKDKLAKARFDEEMADVQDGEDSDKLKRRGAKGPQYAGGLVLEPKKGLYERFILLLDFNSLYPSIIQEYNICFTTVNRPDDGSVPPLPDATDEKAVLPRLIGALVQRRRRVKELIKGERDPTRREQLNIRQQALKLLANSMYGCLGFSNSRFYAKAIAELITSQGREILQSTVDLVQGNLGKEVIYGDTDSIMVNTDSVNIADVLALGQAIKKEVNKRYRLLEIEIDGVFKCMLLLKKKKYAAVKVERGPDGSQVEVTEAKGLDMVRRDWCPLAKQASHFALDRILSGNPREEVVASIHEHLRSISSAVKEDKVPLHKFVITKQLTKRPEDYPDAKNQPHVQVALRRRASGKRDGVAPGETVPYIICVEYNEEGNPITADKGLAERAYGPDEVASSNGRLRIDTQYYISQQIFPVVSRLVAPIEGTDIGHIAESLGLDPSRYRGTNLSSSMHTKEDALLIAASGLDDDDRFKKCKPLILHDKDGQEVTFHGVRDLLKGSSTAAESTLLSLAGDGNSPRIAPAKIANQVQLRMRDAVSRYYEGKMRSDDDMMPCPTRNICLRESSDGRPGGAPPDPRCSGTMHAEVSEADLYTELSYCHRLFDIEGAIHALNGSEDAKLMAIERLAPLRPLLHAGSAAAAEIRDKSAFRWIDLGSTFSRLTTS